MWFENGVQQALNKSRDEKQILMVYVFAEDEISNQMTNLFETDLEVRQKIEENMIALKLEEKSDNAKMFSQIYPIMSVPSTYFISHDSTPLELIGGYCTKQTALDFIGKAIQKHKDRLSPTQTGIPVQPSTSTSESAVESNLAEEEKVKKTKALLEELRSKKAKAEEEEKNRREKERIQHGKELQKAKKQREDQEFERLVKERELEQLEAKYARERVLAQIKADQEERKAREQDDLEALKKELCASENSTPKRLEAKEGEVKVQFRLPEGEAITKVFSAQQPLLDARTHLEQEINMSNFSLLIPYPKRVLNTQDYELSFEQLDLTPSCVLLVKYEAQNKVIKSSSFFIQFWQLIQLPIILIFATIRTLFTMIRGPTPIDVSPPNNSNLNNVSGTSNRQSEPMPKNSLRFRTLNSKDDDDDENKTYNGNSTQQM